MGEKTLKQIIGPLLDKYGLSMHDWRTRRKEVISNISEIYKPSFEAGEKPNKRIAHLLGKTIRRSGDGIVIIPEESYIFSQGKGNLLNLPFISKIEETTLQGVMADMLKKADITKPIVGYDFLNTKNTESNVVIPSEVMKAYTSIRQGKVICARKVGLSDGYVDSTILGSVESLTEKREWYNFFIKNVPFEKNEHFFDLEVMGHADCKKHFYGGSGYYKRSGFNGSKMKENYMCSHVIALYLAHYSRDEVTQNPFMMLEGSSVHFNVQLDNVLREKKGKIEPLNNIERSQMVMKYLMMQKQFNNKEEFTFTKKVKEKPYKKQMDLFSSRPE